MDHRLDQAIQAYSQVASQLKDIPEFYPFFENNIEDPVGENPRSQKAAKHLQAALEAEIAGEKLLKQIIEKLS